MMLKARDRWLLMATFALASAQFVGFGLEIVGAQTLGKSVRGVGLVSAAAPLPLVFSAHDGLETFAQTYAVTLKYPEGASSTERRVEIDSRLYGRTSGSYNRRNIYGAAFSHGPVIARSEGGITLIDSILSFGLCGKGPLSVQFDLPPNATSVEIESKPHRKSQPTWRHTVRCP